MAGLSTLPFGSPPQQGREKTPEVASAGCCLLLFTFMGTTHGFLFGALAELLDNARDAGAGRLDVFSVDNEKLQGGFMLCFLDDGCGMSPEEASDIINFGTHRKHLPTLKFIGQYGNGLKSGSMRIGKDFILFTKKEETMTCVLFSQTFCEGEGLSEVVVPMPSWLTRTRESVTDDPQKFSTELSIIYKYSPFQEEAELMQQFDVIYGKCGTLLVVYNLKLLLSGEPELDVKTDKEDILMAGALEGFPETWSFRAYTSVLYFDPCMKIFIQAKKVQTKHLCYCLYKPRKYLYATSSFKGALKNEVKKAQEAVKIAELILKEAQVEVNQPDRAASSSASDILEKALEDVEAKRKNLKEKQRELKKAGTLSLFFGVNVENPSQGGMFLYSNSRLIKMHEKVGPQLKQKSLLGSGVVGIVNIPLEIMEPSHNKQEFLNIQEYNHLLRVMGQYLVQYCKDTGISNRNLTLFRNEFGSWNNTDAEKPLDSLPHQRRQALTIPVIMQCDLCLKWRVLPSSTNYQKREFLDTWICADNPNCSDNSCDDIERLPTIPLGTLSMVSPSRSEKEKQLKESIQRYQNKLLEQQAQENSKTQKIGPPSYDNLRHESLLSFKLSLSQRSQKRNADADPDVELISEIKVVKKSVHKKMKSQEQRTAAALPRNVKPAEIAQVLDKNDADVSLKKEKKEAPVLSKGKQKLYRDAPATEGNPSSPQLKSLPKEAVEDLSVRSGHKATVPVSGWSKIASLPTTSSPSTTVKETVKKLIAILREILLYFAPKYLQSSEFNYTAVEELIASVEIQNVYMAQYEKNMKRKIQSITCDASRRAILNEVSLLHCEQRRKRAEDKLNDLRVKLAALLQTLQLGGPAGDLEQTDAYLEGLLQDDKLLFQNTSK
ncbi:PREDICTED: MORC family CW-type zinc finger protein 1 isoform X2 [Chinchilla lanigera]|uniref:MORC family CW-type zinc finger protein 1 isoform X2 n=1 Tax=Chinchilla lanigera TaxID=34839 RepID=UPI000695ABD0|nr:PREDICTED: MORC family CW-type zinc finger protein 1 isoform X2 [Chinchilla lanigera]